MKTEAGRPALRKVKELRHFDQTQEGLVYMNSMDESTDCDNRPPKPDPWNVGRD